MRSPEGPKTCEYEISGNDQSGITLHFRGRLDLTNASTMINELTTLFNDRSPSSLTVNLENVDYLDDFGALVLLELKGMVGGVEGGFCLESPSERTKKMLSTLKFDSLGKSTSFTKKRPPGILIRLGDTTFRHLSDMKFAISFIGATFLSLIHLFLHPRTLRKEDTYQYMQTTGVDGLPIVALISFLLGLIMAFMSAVQLEQFGANIYVASLVSLAMTRELGPIMTAIIVAGRSGSAFAAEIGTMKISEEVDALFTMGFDPVRFLVVPKLLATVIMVPILTLFSDLFAVAGGLIVGVFMLDLTANSYMAQTIKTLTLFDLFWGLFKSAIFGALIAGIGCLRGFRVRGGAASVGQATTSAVVTSIFFIILSDSLFSVILRYWE